MKKNVTICLLALMLLFMYSCHKQDVSPPGKVATQKLQTDDAAGQRNGSGPYVLNMLIHLSGENEVPPVNTTARGIAHLRVTADKILYSKVSIQQLEEGDALRFAHVHSAPVGVNGPVVITLCQTAADFGENKVIQLTDAQYNFLLNDPAYVNAHSNFHPPGLVRGQIR